MAIRLNNIEFNKTEPFLHKGSLMDFSVNLALIVARGTNKVIGSQGRLPWHLNDDMKFFKSLTTGCPIIMGRNTWESLPKRPLPDRQNIVVSRNGNFVAKGAWLFTDSNVALAAAKSMSTRQGKPYAFVIGGSELYTAVFSKVTVMFITEVAASPSGDVFFPTFKEDEWQVEKILDQSADSVNDHDFVVKKYIRKENCPM